MSQKWIPLLTPSQNTLIRSVVNAALSWIPLCTCGQSCSNSFSSSRPLWGLHMHRLSQWQDCTSSLYPLYTRWWLSGPSLPHPMDKSTNHSEYIKFILKPLTFFITLCDVRYSKLVWVASFPFLTLSFYWSFKLLMFCWTRLQLTQSTGLGSKTSNKNKGLYDCFFVL